MRLLLPFLWLLAVDCVGAFLPASPSPRFGIISTSTSSSLCSTSATSADVLALDFDSCLQTLKRAAENKQVDSDAVLEGKVDAVMSSEEWNPVPENQTQEVSSAENKTPESQPIDSKKND